MELGDVIYGKLVPNQEAELMHKGWYRDPQYGVILEAGTSISPEQGKAIGEEYQKGQLQQIRFPQETAIRTPLPPTQEQIKEMPQTAKTRLEVKPIITKGEVTGFEDTKLGMSYSLQNIPESRMQDLIKAGIVEYPKLQTTQIIQQPETISPQTQQALMQKTYTLPSSFQTPIYQPPSGTRIYQPSVTKEVDTGGKQVPVSFMDYKQYKQIFPETSEGVDIRGYVNLPVVPKEATKSTIYHEAGHYFTNYDISQIPEETKQELFKESGKVLGIKYFGEKVPYESTEQIPEGLGIAKSWLMQGGTKADIIRNVMPETVKYIEQQEGTYVYPTKEITPLTQITVPQKVTIGAPSYTTPQMPIERVGVLDIPKSLFEMGMAGADIGEEIIKTGVYRVGKGVQFVVEKTPILPRPIRESLITPETSIQVLPSGESVLVSPTKEAERAKITTPAYEEWREKTKVTFPETKIFIPKKETYWGGAGELVIPQREKYILPKRETVVLGGEIATFAGAGIMAGRYFPFVSKLIEKPVEKYFQIRGAQVALSPDQPLSYRIIGGAIAVAPESQKVLSLFKKVPIIKTEVPKPKLTYEEVVLPISKGEKVIPIASYKITTEYPSIMAEVKYTTKLRDILGIKPKTVLEWGPITKPKASWVYTPKGTYAVGEEPFFVFETRKVLPSSAQKPLSVKLKEITGKAEPLDITKLPKLEQFKLQRWVETFKTGGTPVKIEDIPKFIGKEDNFIKGLVGSEQYFKQFGKRTDLQTFTGRITEMKVPEGSPYQKIYGEFVYKDFNKQLFARATGKTPSITGTTYVLKPFDISPDKLVVQIGKKGKTPYPMTKQIENILKIVPAKAPSRLPKVITDLTKKTPDIIPIIKPSAFAGTGLYEKTWTPEQQFLIAKTIPTKEITEGNIYAGLKPSENIYAGIKTEGKFMDLGVMESPRIISLEKVTPIEKQQPIEKTKGLERLKSIEELKPIEKLKPIEISKPIERQQPIERQRPLERLKPLEQLKPLERLMIIPRITTTPKIIPREPPPKIPIPPPSQSREEGLRMIIPRGRKGLFISEITKKGKFKPVSIGRLGEVTIAGVKAVKRELGASLRIRELDTGKLIKVPFVSPEFRPSKRDSLILVQKAPTRLMTVQERKAIQQSRQGGSFW